MIIFTSTKNHSDVLRGERVIIASHALIKGVAGLLSYHLFKTLYYLVFGASKLRYVIGTSKIEACDWCIKTEVCDSCIKNCSMSLVVYQHWGIKVCQNRSKRVVQ